MRAAFFLHLAAVTAQVVSLPDYEDDCIEDKGVAEKDGFEITFYDAFWGRPGSLPSPYNWIIDTGTSYPGGPPQWGNSESEVYTTSTSSLTISPSNTLLITPQHLGNGEWISGRIETVRDDFVCAPYSRMFIEARLKLGNAPAAYQQGIWPGFWSIGSAFRGNYNNWPAVGEWDFLESINGLPSMWATVHCGTAPGGPCNEYDGIGNGGSTSFSRGVFHVVGFLVDRTPEDWWDESLTWYLDEEEVFCVYGADVGDEATWDELAHSAHILLFNVAVGGSFPDAVAEENTPTGSTEDGKGVGIEIDYIVVYNS